MFVLASPSISLYGVCVDFYLKDSYLSMGPAMLSLKSILQLTLGAGTGIFTKANLCFLIRMCAL